MTLSTSRNYTILLLALCAASAAAAAPFSPSSNTSLGLPDRDIVRDPYGSFVPALGGFIAPQASSIVGPNLGLGAGSPPSLFFGGGGGGSGGGSLPGFFALPANAPSFTTPGQGGSNASSVGSSGPGGPSTTITFSAQTDQSTVPSVPDGGASVVLMGTGLLALGALRRRSGWFRY